MAKIKPYQVCICIEGSQKSTVDGYLAYLAATNNWTCINLNPNGLERLQNIEKQEGKVRALGQRIMHSFKYSGKTTAEAKAISPK